jgi:methylamine dehydrogenase accessory protein MauD
MSTFFLISSIALWLVVLFLGFLLLGALRALGILRWQLEQLQATTPSRMGRDGLRVGKKAPAFSLPSTNDKVIALADFAGRKVLLVFTQSGCSPCKAIVPELNRLAQRGTHQLLVVNNAAPDKTRAWASEVGARFPVLAQENYAVSKRFQVFATPFAFLIDEKGIITSKGLAGSKQHLNFVLSGAGKKEETSESESSTRAGRRRIVRNFRFFHKGGRSCLSKQADWQRSWRPACRGAGSSAPWAAGPLRQRWAWLEC